MPDYITAVGFERVMTRHADKFTGVQVVQHVGEFRTLYISSIWAVSGVETLCFEHFPACFDCMPHVH